jgi:hypothetical protein
VIHEADAVLFGMLWGEEGAFRVKRQACKLRFT